MPTKKTAKRKVRSYPLEAKTEALQMLKAGQSGQAVATATKVALGTIWNWKSDAIKTGTWEAIGTAPGKAAKHVPEAKPPRRSFSSAFKLKAVQRVLNGEPVAQVARQLGISESGIHNWRADFFHMRDNGTNPETLTLEPGTAEADHLLDPPRRATRFELEELQTRIKRLESERDALMAALAVFSRNALR